MNWVLEGKIAVASTPRDEKDILEWIENGVKAVVSLLNEADLPPTWLSLEEVHKAIEEKGLELYKHQVLSKRAPSPEKALEIVKWIDEKITSNRPVVIVCGRGWGRGGSIVAAYLVYKGAEPGDAVDYVNSRAREFGGEPIESAEQEKLPYRLRELLRLD